MTRQERKALKPNIRFCYKGEFEDCNEFVIAKSDRLAGFSVETETYCFTEERVSFEVRCFNALKKVYPDNYIFVREINNSAVHSFEYIHAFLDNDGMHLSLDRFIFVR